MARTPVLAPMEYQRLVAMVEKLGYDPAKLRPVPQRWP
jgi:apolipoprotein D and lipocalin family protein